MASTSQPTLSTDFETALAKFVAHGPVNTQLALEEAVFDLLIAMQTAESEVSSLLAAISYKITGLLEAVMTSRNDPGFTLRGRVLKTIQKGSRSPNPVFTACAERLGRFFLRLPRSITLDHSIIAKHLAFTARLGSPDPSESEYFIAKKEKPVVPVSPTAPKTPKSSKRKTRFVPLDVFTEEASKTKSRRKSAALTFSEEPTTPTLAASSPADAPSFSEQLTDCLTAFFTACLEDGIQEFALQDLYVVLNPSIPVVQPPSARRRNFTEPSLSAPETTIVESPNSNAISLPETFLAPHDIARLLSLGSFTESNHSKLFDQADGVPIYTADLGGDLCLVYHIDFGAPTDGGFESQFIRIFGVYSTPKIDLDFWKAVGAHLGGRGNEYIKRCTGLAGTRGRSRRATTVSPLVFPPLDVSHWNQLSADVEVEEDHRLELHRILSLEKFVPLSHTFFDAIQKFNEASFMFSVAPPENQIIKYPSSCLVLGRSGTGKTTCMVFRMIGLDVAAKKSGQVLRQVFVTQSRTLARKVRLYCAQLMQTEAEILMDSAPKPSQGLSLLDMDENADEEGVLPARFSELDDCHFPLFITYDQLCKLLEADFDLQLNPSPLPAPRTARARNKKSSARQPLISFDYFDSKIWPHMDHRVKRGLHSALVYSEFMGIIKGSEPSLSKPRHYLDQKEYESQNNRSLSGDTTERSRVYTLFEAYQKLRPSTSYDIADRVHLLAATLRDQGVPGKPLDFLYVDEAQDNLIIDAALLRTLCPNPHGLFFAGDTAQTISVGSAFRFSELKAFLYRLEREDVHVKRGGRPPIDPKFFQLSTNYRSHSGIVNAAAFIVDLLNSYFQHSIDSLAPEVANVDVTTHKPLFFSGMKNQADFLKLISDSGTGKVELGAHQVIIVRNPDAAKALKEAVVGAAVVLTLYESKGMEFNDSLLVSSGRATSHNSSAQMPQVAVMDDPTDEWAAQAKEYFAKSLFWEAAFCFRKAEMSWWSNVAGAYANRQEAMGLAEKHPHRSTRFLEVAQTFDHLAQESDVAEDSESWRLLCLNAAECYAVHPDHERAANAFLKARRYTDAAYHYRMAGMFDEALEILRAQAIDPELAESITKAWQLCSSKEDYIEFLQDNGFEKQRIDFLDSVAEHEEAAQALWVAKDYISAVLRFRRSTKLSSKQKAARCLLEGMRANVFFVTSYRNPSDVLVQLFKLNDGADLSTDERDEVAFFDAVINLESRALKHYGKLFSDAQHILRTILALDAWTQSGALNTIASASETEVAEALVLCRRFGSVIKTVVRTPSLLDYPDIQHIFGVSSAAQVDETEGQNIESRRTVQATSFIYGPALAFANRHQQPASKIDSITLPKDVVDDMIRRTLLERLNAVVDKVDSVARKSRAFELCTRFLSANQCSGKDDGTCWRDHVHEKDLTIQQFNSRFRVHILSISVIDCFTAIDRSFSEEISRVTKQKIWIAKLFRLCYPPTNQTGNLSDITPELIPEYSSVMPTVKCWLHEVFRSLRPSVQPHFFLSNLLMTSLLATAFNQKEAHSYLWRGQWSMDYLVALRDGLIQPTNRLPVAGSAIRWFDKATRSRTNLGTHFLDHILSGRIRLDIEVAIAFAEELCAQLILNHYSHTYTGFDGLTMPRSWIIRAFARGHSLQTNGSTPWFFTRTLGIFLEVLTLKRDPGQLQMQRKPLREMLLPARGNGIARICRCLALIGCNIARARDPVMDILRRLGRSPPFRPEFYGYATSLNWAEVLKTLKESSTPSNLDELVNIRQKGIVTSSVSGIKTITCPDGKTLLKNLQLSPHPPVIALQGQAPSLSGGQAPTNATPKEEEKVQLESVASTAEDQKSALIIQAFFRRHRRRAGGPIPAAFEDLVKKLDGVVVNDRPSKDLLLCLRGPLPHVLAYLKAFHETCQAATEVVTKEMQMKSHEMLDELREKKDEIRSIHREVKRIFKDIQPSSDFYYHEPSKTLVSVSEIVERVRPIPSLVSKIQEFSACPTDADYDLGVEPLLSNRVPWVPKAADDHDGSAFLSESGKGVTSQVKPQMQPGFAQAERKEEDLQLESKPYTKEEEKRAIVIQAFFRRHKRRAGGPIARAFEDLAKNMAEDPDGQHPSRYLLLCVRGPVPHVLAYLRRLHEACLTRVRTLTKVMQDSGHVMIEELRKKKDDARSIHREVKRIIKDLHPYSELYCQGPQFLVSEIVARVQEIPTLVTKIREFAVCPEDTDYDLGVEPLLSERVPWL
ncbi:hypothetical protein FS837_002663 [Tulasnella sp. UAMH 9824]|nr:hypothetical protein FS837_002663 [Tulasnella sp. UAMH 9824]